MPVQADVTNPRTIVLLGKLSEKHEEYPADAALKPGHLLIINSTGECLKHATAAGVTAPIFAKEQSLLGNGIDDAFAAGDAVPVHYAQKGDRIYARLAANATAVVQGSAMESAGDGTLRIFGSGHIIGYCHVAVDNSAVAAEAMVEVDIR